MFRISLTIKVPSSLSIECSHYFHAIIYYKYFEMMDLFFPLLDFKWKKKKFRREELVIKHFDIYGIASKSIVIMRKEKRVLRGRLSV